MSEFDIPPEPQRTVQVEASFVREMVIATIKVGNIRIEVVHPEGAEEMVAELLQQAPQILSAAEADILSRDDDRG
jgi:hypothetical protein